jgi:tetratricopeptide (TPR) repeat protein
VLNGERGDLVTAAARFAEAGDLYRLCGDADGEISVAGNEADIARMRGHYAQAQALLERASPSYGCAAMASCGRTLGSLANVAWEQGRYGAARNYLEEGLALVRLSGHTYEICSMVIDLGGVAVDEGNYAYARRALDEALVMARAHSYHSLIAIALTEMARLMLLQDDAAQGSPFARRPYVVRQSGELYYENKIMLILAESLRAQGRLVDARARYGDALTAARRLGTSVLTSRAVHGLATLTARDTPDRAVRLWGLRHGCTMGPDHGVWKMTVLSRRAPL